MVGVSLAGVLFWIGVGYPYMVEQDYPTYTGPLVLRDAEERKKAYIATRAAATKRDYYVGALGPAVILGACALLTAFRGEDRQRARKARKTASWPAGKGRRGK